MDDSKNIEKVKKISLFSKIRIKKTQIVDKIKQNYSKSDEANSVVTMLGSIILYGILLIFAYLSFVTPSIYLKALGFGCGFWLLSNKIVPIIISILNSFKPISK